MHYGVKSQSSQFKLLTTQICKVLLFLYDQSAELKIMIREPPCMLTYHYHLKIKINHEKLIMTSRRHYCLQNRIPTTVIVNTFHSLHFK